MSAGPSKSLAELEQVERVLGIGQFARSASNIAGEAPPPLPIIEPARTAVSVAGSRATSAPPPKPIEQQNVPPRADAASLASPKADAGPLAPSRADPAPTATPRMAETKVNWRLVGATVLAAITLALVGKTLWLMLQPPLEAELVAVPDGDSLDVRISGRPVQRVDIADIDAPDRDTASGRASRDELSEIVQGESLRVWYAGETPDGRAIMIVHAGTKDVARAMTFRGSARPCPYLMRDPLLPVLARLQTRGEVQETGLATRTTRDSSCVTLQRGWVPDSFTLTP